MFKKLKRKFIAVNMLLVSTVLFVVFGLLFVSTYKKAANDSKEALKNTLMRGPEGGFTPPKLEIGERESGKHSRMFPVFCITLDADGTVTDVFKQNVEISDEALALAVEGVQSKNGGEGILKNLNLRWRSEPTSEGGVRIAFVDMGTEKDSIKSLVTASLFVGIIGLGSFFLISLFLAEWALGPVRRAWASQKQFVADASHELKTPITVILANTGILLSHKEDTIGKQKKWVEYISAEAGRMKELVEDMLFLAKSDAEDTGILKVELNFSDLVWSCLLPFESVAFEQGVGLKCEVAPDITLIGNEGQLKQLTVILLDNACKYAGSRGTVTLSMAKEQDRIRLCIQNSGPAIPADQLKHLFERFYRADESRARNRGGYGLGLAIAKRIVENHKGKITVESSEKCGTVFTVYF